MTVGVIGTVAASGWRMHGYAGSGWWMGGMMMWMVVFWVAVCVGVMWLARPGWCSSWARSSWGSSTHEEALGTLERRFAEGAISFDEYRERKAVLKGEPFEGATLKSDSTTGEGAGS